MLPPARAAMAPAVLDPLRAEQLGDDVVGQGPEAHALRARPDRRQERVGHCRKEDEVGARPRLLERLQERVGGGLAELLGAAHDEDLRPPLDAAGTPLARAPGRGPGRCSGPGFPGCAGRWSRGRRARVRARRRPGGAVAASPARGTARTHARHTPHASEEPAPRRSHTRACASPNAARSLPTPSAPSKR